MYFRQIFFFFALFSAFSAFGQISTTSDTSKMDTLFFLNGEVRAVKVVDTVADMVRFLPSKKKRRIRVQEIEQSKIFSLKFSNGQERIIYFQDSSLGNVFSVLEAKMFMLGEQEAEKNYRNKWPFIIGFAVGSVSPILFTNAVLLSPLPAAAIPLHTLLPNIHVNTKAIQNKNYLQYDTYVMGYERVARKKNFMHALIGAGVGLAVGFGTWAVPDKAWNSIGIDTDVPPIPPKSIQYTPFGERLKTVAKRNFIYGIWAVEAGCSIGISAWRHHRHKKLRSEN